MKNFNPAALTTHEKQKQLKQISGELDEELSVTGQESETQAVKWVQEKGREERHEESEKIAEATWMADDNKKKIFGYRDAILNYFISEMKESIDHVPYDFFWYPAKDSKQGIILWIRDPQGKFYALGMKPCFDPKYDIQCVLRIIGKALDHMQELDEQYRQPAIAT